METQGPLRFSTSPSNPFRFNTFMANLLQKTIDERRRTKPDDYPLRPSLYTGLSGNHWEQLTALFLYGRHQSIEGLGEFIYTLVLKFLHGPVQVDTQRLGLAERLPGLIQPLLQGRGHLAVVPESRHRSRRHGDYSVRPNKSVHVIGVRVGRVFSGSGSEQHPLGPSA